MLKLFEKYGIKATWFIPGHSLETFPEESAMIRDAGHEMYPPSPTRLYEGPG
jgi:peptidoglycan/xylan/chitin deacetylase (PgdA/CDA1 family)